MILQKKKVAAPLVVALDLLALAAMWEAATTTTSPSAAPGALLRHQ
jgi:hypothetical protein